MPSVRALTEPDDASVGDEGCQRFQVVEVLARRIAGSQLNAAGSQLIDHRAPGEPCGVLRFQRSIEPALTVAREIGGLANEAFGYGRNLVSSFRNRSAIFTSAIGPDIPDVPFVFALAREPDESFANRAAREIGDLTEKSYTFCSQID